MTDGMSFRTFIVKAMERIIWQVSKDKSDSNGILGIGHKIKQLISVYYKRKTGVKKASVG